MPISYGNSRYLEKAVQPEYRKPEPQPTQRKPPMPYAQAESSFLRILEQAGPEGVMLSMPDFAARIGCCVKTVQTVKQRLLSQGKITIEQTRREDGRKAADRYRLAFK